jgi:hypothetical protein
MVNGAIMSDRSYNRVANVLMLIGVASALAFDSGKVPHVVAGGVGIVAGVGALLLYFCSSAEAPQKEEVKAVQPASVKVEGVSVGSSVSNKVFLDAGAVYGSLLRDVPVLYGHNHAKYNWGQALWRTEANAIEAYRRETAQLWLSHYAMNHARKLQWHVINAHGAGKHGLMEPEVELSPNEVAACAIEIILGLAKSDKGNHWEYSMGPKGLRVAARRSSPMRPVITVTQNDFDFGDFTMAYGEGSESILRDPS